ncbi:hypothetical protein L1987_54775 [Smallanthus sonchifolius]|uniref:Uncharacterized protein n=1 Tax=Smallanthus sonchifolius TaxID=185202 RepID=A0ACB9E8R2_9ASTR|nr:hypothetical protein L1987_54775 [Smallanthus sonchifolius]
MQDRLLNTTECKTDSFCKPQLPGCYNNACRHFIRSPIPYVADDGQLSADVFKIHSTNAKNVLTVPRLYFPCGRNRLVDGLASGVTGMAGLGRTRVSLPAQLSSYFKFDNKFGLCLSSSTRSSGAVFFGDGPYTLLPNVDASSSLTYTPLIVNPFVVFGENADASSKYYIGVKSIKVNGKHVKGYNETLLSVDDQGEGETVISTVNPYTIMNTSIYKAIEAAFVKAMPKNVEKVTNVAPFGACFSSKNIRSTRLGPDVPSIDLVLQSKNVWRINGANSMVKVKKNVLCLGFVDAGPLGPNRENVVIGGHQIEDNPLQFDISASRLGFS